MKRLVKEYEKSGVTRREFCQGRGMAVTTFDYWRRELGGKPKLVKVEVAAHESSAHFTLAL
ncbi:MAG: hypothetical protein ABI995_12570, partial [Acidobacteriota bacterium]